MFVFSIVLFFNLPVKGTDSFGVTKAFSTIWEEIEELRSFNASKLESLDVHDSLGKVDPQSVEDAMDTARISIKAGNNGIDEYNIALFYYCSVRDTLEDYYLSEYLSSSMEILYQQLVLGAPSIDLYSQISGDILSVINSISTSIVDGINTVTTDSNSNGLNDDLLRLISEAEIFAEKDLYTYSSFYFDETVANNPALSKVVGGAENVFLGRLFFRVLASLEKIFTKKASLPEVETITAIRDEVTSNFFRGFENAYNSHLIDRKQKTFSNFLKKGQFRFSNYEADILKLIDRRLKDVFGDLAENSPFVVSEVNKTKKTPIAHKSSKKKKKKGPKKGKKKKGASAKPKKPIGKKKQDQESLVSYGADANLSSPLEESLPQDLELDEETKIETIEDETDVIEFDLSYDRKLCMRVQAASLMS